MNTYQVYREMAEKTKTLEDIIRSSISRKGGKIYSLEVYVGSEESKEYEIYLEYRGTHYQYLHGVFMTEEQIIKKFN